MAIPKRLARRIDVDGHVFHWTVSRRQSPGLLLVVELAGGGSQLLASLDFGNVITPQFVRDCIAGALHDGWRPATRGAPHRIQCRGQVTERSCAFQCPCCDYYSLMEWAGWSICPVCFWEVDSASIEEPDRHSSPNQMTLREGRANFERIGACSDSAAELVCPPEIRARYRRQIRNLPAS